MKNNKTNIKTIIIVILIGIIISLISIILNMKNKNIEGQEISKEQLGETTTESSYISLEAHNLELKEKQQELDSMQNTAGQATATASQILKNYTAYKDGKLITGTMANNGALNWNPSSSTSKSIAAGYYSGGTISTANAYNAGYNSGRQSMSFKIPYLELRCGGNSSAGLSSTINIDTTNYNNLQIGSYSSSELVLYIKNTSNSQTIGAYNSFSSPINISLSGINGIQIYIYGVNTQTSGTITGLVLS